MCQSFFRDSRFYWLLTELDRQIAESVRSAGCGFCGGVLHRGDFPRKPRGAFAFDETSDTRRCSLCCAEEGCRRRTTPPSVRFLGRKVYLGVVVILITALQHGLSPRRRRELADRLDLSPKTFYRWRNWWREVFAASATWRGLSRRLLPPPEVEALPGALLGRLPGEDLEGRVMALLIHLLPLTTGSPCADSLRGWVSPQKMG